MKFLTSIFLVCLTHFALGQYDTIRKDDSTRVDYRSYLVSLPISDIINMKVTVASKTPEKVSDAPSIVTSYSDRDIENYGYYTLSDLASITSGYSAFKVYGEQTFETRGQKSGSWNNQKHLVLVDGIPINDVNSYSAPMEYNLPLYMANQVTFLKGPSSALYGTSAFFGVIDVKPKTLDKNGTKIESKISAGSFGNEKRVMANGLYKDDEGEFFLSLGYYNRQESGDFLGSNNVTDPDSRNWDDDNSLFLNSTYRIADGPAAGLKLGVIISRKSSHMGDFWGPITNLSNSVTREQYIPYLKYDRELSKRTSVNSYFKYNASSEESNFIAYWKAQPNGNVTQGYHFRFGNAQWVGEINYKLKEKHSLIGGLYYDWRTQFGSPQSSSWTANNAGSGSSYTTNEEWEKTQDDHTYSIYGQYRGEFDLLSGTIITLGARLDNGVSQTNQYHHLSPRLGVVQKLTKWMNMKILYGQALRSPGLREISGNASSTQIISDNGGDASGVRDLGAESIRSTEFGVTFTPERWNISMVYFNNKTTESLNGEKYTYTDKDGNVLSPTVFGNSSGNIKAEGVEIDVILALRKRFKVFANYSFASSQENDSIQVTRVPTQKINAGITYVLPIRKCPVSVSLISKNAINYWVSYTMNEDGTQQSAGNNGAKTKGYNFIDMNFLFPVSKRIGFELQVKNMFDQQWHQPSEDQNINRDILYPGRNFLATFRVSI
jgi:outer membrane receptor for ferrienterochelin and colicins